MKLRISLMVCTASLFVALPVLAQHPPSSRQGQGNDNRGQHGNNSNHSGHDEDGSGKGHDDDNDGNDSNHSGHDEDGSGKGHKDDKGGKGHGDNNLVLASSEVRAAVANAATSVTAALSSGSLRTSSGVVIPASAQAHTYSVLIADPTLPASSVAISAALSTAGPEANAIVPSLMRSLSGLGSNPATLPSAIAQYNRFTKAASGEFIANPPPEFLVLHTVLARLTAAARGAK